MCVCVCVCVCVRACVCVCVCARVCARRTPSGSPVRALGACLSSISTPPQKHFYAGCIMQFLHKQGHVHVHEQSYYIVHYIRRKEEGKEGRKKRINTNNLQQPQRLTKIYMCTHSQLQQLRKIFNPIRLEKYIHTLTCTG